MPSGVGVVAVVFSPKYAEHGGALTNAGDGLAAGPADGRISAVDSSSPTTDVIDAGRVDGTDSADSGARSVLPLTLNAPKVVPNAAAAWARVPSACTYRWLPGV